jgi:Sulfotransferase domain
MPDTQQPQKFPSVDKTELLKYVLILGKGRSGTTWLAQILNSYEHCSYKHEPFLPKKRTGYNQWLNTIETETPDILHQQLDALCRGCDWEVDMPPFPPKSFRRQNASVLHGLYGLGKRMNALKFMYEWYGKSPLTPETPVLIKDVNFATAKLSSLCHAIDPHVLFVVRNPFGNIASYLKGIELNLMGARSQRNFENTRQFIESPEGEAFVQYRDRIDSMSLAQFEALRWRIEVEPVVEFAKTCDRCFVVVYDDLCADPHRKTAEIFDFIGWQLGQPTRDFIDRSISSGQPSDPKKAYYSVFRDPQQNALKWKTQLTREQIADIASVICDSPLVDLWQDLPLN